MYALVDLMNVAVTLLLAMTSPPCDVRSLAVTVRFETVVPTAASEISLLTLSFFHAFSARLFVVSLHLVEPLLRVLRIGVHDAAGQVRCHPGDGDVDGLADAGRSRGHGDGGGSRRDRGDRAICADCGDTRVAARVGHVIDGRVIGRHRIRDPLAVANAQRHRGRVECDAGDHVRLMGHDDLGAVDQRVRGIRVPLACNTALNTCSPSSSPVNDAIFVSLMLEALYRLYVPFSAPSI